MQLGQTRRRYPSHAAMWPELVVVLPPDRCGAPGLVQRLEPLFVQTFIPELAVEALDIAVLHRPARLDQDVPDAVAVCPGVGADRNLTHCGSDFNRRRHLTALQSMFSWLFSAGYLATNPWALVSRRLPDQHIVLPQSRSIRRAAWTAIVNRFAAKTDEPQLNACYLYCDLRSQPGCADRASCRATGPSDGCRKEWNCFNRLRKRRKSKTGSSPRFGAFSVGCVP